LGPGAGTGGHAIEPAWALVPILGSLSWAWGSLWSRRTEMPRSPIMSTAVGLTTAGVVLLALSAGSGGFAPWQPRATPAGAWVAPLSLPVFGSLIVFGAYLFLLRHVAPSIVATYAFVNPVVAMLLGSLFGGETLGPRTLVAAAVVLVAVVLITTAPPLER